MLVFELMPEPWEKIRDGHCQSTRDGLAYTPRQRECLHPSRSLLPLQRRWNQSSTLLPLLYCLPASSVTDREHHSRSFSKTELSGNEMVAAASLWQTGDIVDKVQYCHVGKNRSNIYAPCDDPLSSLVMLTFRSILVICTLI